MKIILQSLFCLVFISACSEQYEVNRLKLNTQVDRIHVGHSLPKVDVLLMLDTHYLGPSFKKSLRENGGQLLQPIKDNNVLDVHIGMATTSIDVDDEVCGRDGKLISTPDSPGYVNARASHASKALEQKLGWVPDCHPLISWHRPFSAVTESLSFIGGETQGFYRSDASLAVIFVTGTSSDEGDIAMDELKRFLLDLKGGNSEKIALYGAIIEKNDPFGCLGNKSLDTAPIDVQTIISDFKGLSFNLCSPLLPQELKKIGSDISHRFGELFIPLEQVPASGTILVSHQGYLLQQGHTNGWTYDPNRKGIRVGTKVMLPQRGGGDFLDVSFFPATLTKEDDPVD